MPKNDDGWYGVEYSMDPHSALPPDSIWDTKEERDAEAEKLINKGFRCVWLCQWSEELGDWLYNWWTKETLWGELPASGFGRRSARGKDYRLSDPPCSRRHQ